MAQRRWGMTESEWAAAADELITLLETAAVERRTVTYGEAARRAFSGRFSARSGALMDLLADVDTRAFEGRGIVIASLVVRADTGRPGEGYFAFAERELGLGGQDREAFWRDQAEQVWSAYDTEAGS